MWAVAFSMRDVASSMWAVTASAGAVSCVVWAVTSTIWDEMEKKKEKIFSCFPKKITRLKEEKK